MVTRVRTIDFLPDIFRTRTNSQFLSATLDQLVQQPDFKRIQGYVGAKFGYGINANDKYLVEPSKIRTDYQLEPTVVITKPETSDAVDAITYPEILDALKLQNGYTDNNNNLFKNQFYSWDSFCDLDKLVNYYEYYWLPNGPDPLVVTTETILTQQNYIVNYSPTGYTFTTDLVTTEEINPPLTLVRGGTYNFNVNQNSKFWIQTLPGLSGVDPAKTNVSTRNIFGVTNNGASNGVITFTVPLADAQNNSIYPGNFKIDLVTSYKFNQLNGALLSNIENIDGISNLNNKTLLFYGSSPTDIGYVGKFYGDNFDINDNSLNPPVTVNVTATTSGTNALTISDTSILSVNDGILFNENVFGGVCAGGTIIVTETKYATNSLVTDSTSSLFVKQQISFADNLGTIVAGKQYYIESIISSTEFTISQTPSGPAEGMVNDVGFTSGSLYGGLYYVKEILSGTTFTISQEPNGTEVELETANSSTYGVMPFVTNQGYFEEVKASQVNKHYYKINLLPTSNGDAVIRLTEEGILPDDTNLVIQYGKQYIGRKFVKNTYAEISLVNFITASLDSLYYQDSENPDLVGRIKLIDNPNQNSINIITDILGQKNYTSPNNIKFTNGLKVIFQGNIYPQIYKSGEYYVEGVGTGIELLSTSLFENPELTGETVTTPWDSTGYDELAWGETLFFPTTPDYILIARNSINRSAWSRTNRWFHSNVLKTVIEHSSYSPISLAALGNSNSRAKRPIIEFYPNLKLFNLGSVAKPNTSFINFSVTDAFTQVAGQTSFSPDGPSSYLFDGCTVIFAGDENLDVRNKIWLVNFESIDGIATPVINLTIAADGYCQENDQTIITQGETHTGETYWFNGANWVLGQQKTTINQPPKFDLFDNNGISFGDTDFYPSSDFDGCTLFEYALGSGSDDPVLLFPLKYSSIDNKGDYQFNVPLTTQTFNYVNNQVLVKQSVSTGYVYNYSNVDTYTREIGWQTAVEESFQYQVFDLKYAGTLDHPEVVCDIKAKNQTETEWPVIVVYKNNSRLDITEYSYSTTSDTTLVTFNKTPVEGEHITIMIYSDQVSKTAYYQIPLNLDHNPFNSPISFINLGDIRGHYKSICNNIPSKLVGPAFGSNNYRDLGNVVPYGTKIIQSSAPLVEAAAFLKTQNSNFFNSLQYNANEYVKYKGLLIQLVTNSEYNLSQPPNVILDGILEELTATKSSDSAFFWSDMLPSKNALITNTYRFNSQLDTSVFTLSRVYSFTEANYYGVLVYLTTRVNNVLQTIQLLKDIDYTISSTDKSLTITKDLVSGDIVTIKEYDQTYGSYVPNTPTKLGLYPSFIPQVILDNTYLTPTYFIQGHDGSYNKLYGTYTDGVLNDIRDILLLEFETRIYNNLKISAALPLTYDMVVPGQFRDTGVSYEDYLRLYNYQFLNWVGLNRIDFKSHLYLPNNSYTYNYRGSRFNFNNKIINNGNWRGIYLWLYDTANPDTAPWEMLGLVNKPSWWDTRYGVAPYTSDNTFMWQDIADGYVYNNGEPYINKQRIRVGLLDIIPVDSNGNLKSPFDFLLGSYNVENFGKEWEVADFGPVEYSYFKSSSYPFDLMRTMALLKPAKFFSLGIDVDKYKYNAEFNQYLFNGRTRELLSDITIYGKGQSVNSYINWIVDYLYQFGLNGTTIIEQLIQNLDVRLSYRLAGFSDQDLLSFFIEKGSTNSKNNALIIPDNSYDVLLYENEPSTIIVYSSVIVQKVTNGYAVFGNNQLENYFRAKVPVLNGLFETLTVESIKTRVPTTFYDATVVIPYGHVFKTIDELSTFIKGYGLYLESLGIVFEGTENGIPLTWNQMILELLYWIQTGWEVGSTINVNPNARELTVVNDLGVIQPLTFAKENFILNQNFIPIAVSDLFIERQGTSFSVKALNEGDTVSLFKANVSTIENIVIFDNVTIFNDVIYNLITGLRQQRIYVSGQKSAEWQGYVNAAGYIINQDNVVEWIPNQKYTRGTIVKYKNKYYMAKDIVIIPQPTFDYNQWLETSYTDIQKGLLPNPSTRAYESTLFYNTNNLSFDNDQDLLGGSLIGFRPRQYFADANLSDTTQVNLYKNIISAKGTIDSVTRLEGINIQQNQLNYNVFENWAIKQSEYGGLLNQNFIEITLNESLLTGNPSIVGLVQNQSEPDAQQTVPLYNIKNYGRPVIDTNILPTISYNYEEKLPSAGYVNMQDVTAFGYNLGLLPDDAIDNVYKNEYIWLADKDSTWQIYTPVSTGALVINVLNNVNGSVTLQFNKPHGLLKNQVIGIINFDPRVNGFHLITSVGSLTSCVVSLDLDPIITSLTGQGVSYLLQSQRVNTARDITNLPLLNAEYGVNKVWIDNDVDGIWAVYEKTNNYSSFALEQNMFTDNFGGAVDYVPNVGYFISDITQGKVFHYDKSPNDIFYLRNTITVGGNFGTAIVHCDDIIVISNPDDIVSQIFIYRLPPSRNINSITLEQVISVTGGRVGDAMDISGDGNLLYLGAKDDETVLAFQRDITLTYEASGLSLSTATVVGQNSFVVSGDETLSIAEGQRVNFVTNYENLSMTLQFNSNAGSYLFRVAGDQRGKLTNGDTIAFNNAGSASTYLYTIANEAYDPGTNRTTFYTVEMRVNAVIAGTPVYKVTFADDAVYTVVTGSYDDDSNRTTFFTIEDIEYTATSGSNIFFAKTNFGLVGAITAPVVDVGDKFGFSVATNQDGSKLFVGAPYDDYNVSLQNTGIVYAYDRLVENFEIQYDQPPNSPYLIILPFTPTNQTRIYVNGVLLDNSKYVIILNVVVIGTIGMFAGDIVTISSAQFVLNQQIYAFDNLTDLRQGELFGYSLDTNKYGSELIVGSPFEVFNDVLTEGAVFRFTNEGKRYGIITGLIATNLTSSTYIYLNGFRVTLTPGNAAHVANQINQSNITNIFAYSTEDGRLVIRLRDINLGPINNKLNLSVFNATFLFELGFTDYIKSQTIQDPHKQTSTQFGYKVKFNDENSFVVGAPVSTRYINTTFDFTDDANIHNDTVFDNNLTTFEDGNQYAGSVYMFDYIQSYDESLLNIGKFVYAQSLNDIVQQYGSNPLYGSALSFNDGVVVVGAPNYTPSDGRVLVWENESFVPNWHLLRTSNPIVNIEKIQKAALYDNITNETLIGLDYIDPLQGKLLGVIGENLDYITSIDPADYNAESIYHGSRVWNKLQLGRLWFDTNSVRFMNYHQNDGVYNSEYWGRVFPGSDVAVYTWIESDVIPAFYEGNGTPYDLEKYTTVLMLDANNNLVPKYYYWVRNTNIISTKLGKSLSDTIIEQYIADPKDSGIAFFAPLDTNVYAFYNAQEYINDTSTNLHLGYAQNNNGSTGHLDFQLIRTNYPSDFLNGFPDLNKGYNTPVGLYDRYLDSFAGVDETGAPVPDYNLPKLLRTGINVRPRQSFFVDRLTAIKNYIQYANSVVKKFPINEYGTSTFLKTQGEFYDTSAYYTDIYWWAEGYSDSTRAVIEVPMYSDLLTIPPVEGLIVGVSNNGQGDREVYKYIETEWVRIGLQNGTIEFSDKLYDYEKYNTGFGAGFDSTPFDSFPSVETRNIVRALNEQIFTGSLLEYRNKSLIKMFEFIQSENIESQNYNPWLTKTSLTDVGYKVRELTENQKFQRDNQSLLEGYINEFKPYHVVLKEFYLEYTKTDTYNAYFTDFDVPAQWSESAGRFISPQLLYGDSTGLNPVYPSYDDEFTSDSVVWSLPQYDQWYNNFGLSISPIVNTEITSLAVFLNITDLEIHVTDAQGLPNRGVIRIEAELIGYTRVDRINKILSGISRGVDGTTAAPHFASLPIFINLPGIVILNEGRDYTEAPAVTAVVDLSKYPAPRKEAILRSVMRDGKVIAVNVIDSGEGYVVPPNIVFDSSISVISDLFRINFVSNTIQLLNSSFVNGETVYSRGISSNGLTIVPDGYYYINKNQAEISLFASVEGSIISLHRTYQDALIGKDPVPFINSTLLPEDYQHEISITARAIPTMVSNKTRSLTPTLKFDRTSYNTKVTPWTPNEFYSSPYLSIGNDASNPTKLYFSNPSQPINANGIDGILATFIVNNVLLGGNYYVTIDNFGDLYYNGEWLRIFGTSLSGYSATEVLDGSLLEGVQIVAMPDTTGITVGDYISADGVPYGATVLSIEPNVSIMMSLPALKDNPNIKLMFLTGNIPNDCMIKVLTTTIYGGILSIYAYGTGIDAGLASLQGAVLPILSATTGEGGSAVISVDYSFSDIKPGQVNGSYMWFYRTHNGYVYNDTGTNFVGSVTGNTLTITAIEAGKTVALGDTLYSEFLNPGTTITAFGSGSGGLGTYTISGLPVNITNKQINTGGGAIIKISRPKFNPTSLNNSYFMTIYAAGFKYNTGDVITISGALLGGEPIVNDAKITVTISGINGEIYSAEISGVAVGEFSRYYVKALTYNSLVQQGTLEIYEDPLLSVPVPYASFMWDGGSGTDYAYLPEPIQTNFAYGYQISSLVSYAGYIWQCIDANNDSEFDPTKWVPLQSYDTSLNALDRIEGYYAPTINMPGKDLQQLVKGITYPNNVYLGNSFAPEDQYPIDTVLRDIPFYPIGVNVKSIVFDGTRLIAIGDQSNTSIVLFNESPGIWTTLQLTDFSLDLTNISYANGQYIITANNTSTPLYVSWNGTDWVTLGASLGWDNFDWDDIGWGSSNIIAPNKSMQSSTYGLGAYFIAGQNISRSTDGIEFTIVYEFPTVNFINNINSIIYVNNSAFQGLIGVGTGYETIGGSISAPIITPASRIVTSIDGLNWTLLTPNLNFDGLNSVTSSTSLNRIVVVGNNGKTYYSSNSNNWVPGNITGPAVTTNINSITFGNNKFIAVGDKTGGTSTDPGLIIVSTDGITWTQVSSSFITTENLNYVYYSAGSFYLVGENNTILQTSDGITYTNISTLESTDPYYVVQGNDFLYGYGPEELVAGVVTDTLSLTVNTAPGAYWDTNLINPTLWYKYDGFNMIQFTQKPNFDSIISFANRSDNPARLSVFILNEITNVSTRIYENVSGTILTNSYTIDWINQTIAIDQPLNVNETILVEIYETGNGVEVIRGNSKNYPFQTSEFTNNTILQFNTNYIGTFSDPLVYASKNGSTLDKLIFNTDYILTANQFGRLRIEFLTDTYNNETDYVVFTVLGDSSIGTNITQYGYSIPETEVFTASSSTTNFALDANLTTVDVDNVANGIVEVNGIRLLPSVDYSFINISGVDYLVLTNPVGVSGTDVVAITTYYDTSRQFITTQEYIDPSDGINVYQVAFVDNTVNPIVVSFTSAPGFSASDLVQFGGIKGAIQLNGLTLYVNPITSTEFELYKESTLTNGVDGIDVSNYTGGGYGWLNSETIIAPYPTVDVLAVDMTYTNGARTWVTINGERLNPANCEFSESAKFVASVSGTTLTVTEISKGKLNIGQVVNNVSITPGTTITGYLTGLGGVGTYTLSSSGTIAISDFTTSYDNRLGIYANVSDTDSVLVTSYVSGESPNPLSYIQTVNKYDEGFVYNANVSNSTWLINDFDINSDTISLYDVKRILGKLEQTRVVETDATYTFVNLQCEFTEISAITVYNESSLTELTSDQFGVQLYNEKPTVIFTSGANAGDNVIVTIYLGNVIQILNERIYFNEVDFDANTLSGLTRGVQGTSNLGLIPAYNFAYGINSQTKLPATYYDVSWNSTNITLNGDPLQVSTTPAAEFLQNTGV